MFAVPLITKDVRMSTGAFTTIGYQATYDATQIHPIRVQPETLGLSVTVGGAPVANDGELATAINNPVSARVSGGRRQKGLNARLIRISFGDSPPDDYKPFSTITLPAVNPALLAAPAGATGTYLATAITVVGTTPERVR